MSEYNENNKGAWLLNDVHFMQINDKWPADPSIAAAGQGNTTNAWFGGGLESASPAAISTVDRIIFASDTATAVAKGPLSVARQELAASGNSTDAWFGGAGYSPSPTSSTVERIIFASDTATAVAKGPLSLARRGLAASGNSTDAWFGGGRIPATVSTVDRIIFASDTATAVAKGPLIGAIISGNADLAASGNSTDAWFGGGSSPSRVDRIIFASDTATAVAKGNLSLARTKLAASGNSTDAWFGGGTIPGTGVIFSTVDRIIFASDTATAVAKGPLSLGRENLDASGNSTDAWFGGGAVGQPSIRSTVDRIIFASDTATAVAKGPLSSARRNLAASS
jgi:hypothetical protein